jgi:hypothetical protein
VVRLELSGGRAGRAYSSPFFSISIYKSKFAARSYAAVAIPPRSNMVGIARRTMGLQTPRLILRPFRADDLDRLAELMANPEFMRFSLGPYTREQTQTILQKFLS